MPPARKPERKCRREQQSVHPSSPHRLLDPDNNVYNECMIRKWDTDDKELGQKCINEVIARIQDIDDPNAAGVIAAQEIIDIILENLAPEIYNKAVTESTKLMQEKLDELQYDLEDLKQM